MITLAEYLVEQLNKLGIEDVFGLPGDFNFDLVGAVEKSPSTNWIGSTNELNAGYCADGYAREKGFGAVITTYGVGELSAINAIAGCKSENVPVIKITGIPSTQHIKNRTLLHHNLETADYHAFYNAYKNVVETSAFLNKYNAVKEINRVINVMVKTRKPVYLAIPTDVATMRIENPNTEIIFPKSNRRNLKKAVEKIMEAIKSSKKPIVIADILAQRFCAKEDLNRFLINTQIPSTCFVRGLDIIDAKTPNYFGAFAGKLDNEICANYLDTSDCIINVGCVYSDLNTMNFAIKPNKEQSIDIQADYVSVKGKKFKNVLIKDVLFELSKNFDFKFEETFQKTFKYEPVETTETKPLTCDYIYSRLNGFLKESDIFVNEVGLSTFGVMKMELPKNVHIHNQILWGSIGWATPCTLGCALAQRNKRVILITGDGAHQLTAQEISTMMRHDVKPIIFVVNNSGYTVERILCEDPNAKYNDIAKWNYAILPQVFKGDCYTRQVHTNTGFDEALRDIEQIQKEKMCYIELFTKYLDIPNLANALAKYSQEVYANLSEKE